MTKTANFLKSGVLALALAAALPIAAHADNGVGNASQGRASNPVQQTGPQAPAQYQN
jgi:hypothetical protein